MNTQRLKTWAGLGALLFIASCKCGGPSGNLGDVLGAYCDFIDRCPDQTGFPIAYRNKGECEQILEFVTTCRVVETKGAGGDYVASLQKLSPNIDAAQAAACKAYLATASCTAPFTGCDESTDAGCNPCSLLLSSGTSSGGSGGGSEARAALDQKCDDSQTKCGDGLYCINAAFVPDAGVGCRVCKPTRPLGGDCGDPPFVPCGTGLFCETTSGSCVSLLGAGAACTGGWQCSSTFCNGTSMTCDPGGHAGEACATVADCRQGYCDAAAHLCADKKVNGSPCAASEECQNAQCDTATLHCGKPDGATCSYAGECQGSCDTTGHACIPGLPVGSTCMSDDQCQSRACEYYPSHTCVASCANGQACPSGQSCNSSNHCHPLLADGSQCDLATDCVSGWCNTQGQCGKPPAIGDTCSNYGDCVPKGYCNAGKCAAFIRPGDACTGLDSCAPPFICQKGTCTLMSLSCEPAPVGSQCSWLQVCDDKGFCDVLNEFTCAPKKAAGASCLRSMECPSNQYCLSGTCSAFSNVGEACSNRQTCAAGLFCDESVTPNQCSGPRPAGAMCQDDVDCESGDCSYTSGTGTVCQAACLMPAPGDQPACHPMKCDGLGYTCGSIDDGCGQMVSCGQCFNSHETCGGGGDPHACGCTPTTACSPRQCNVSVDDGCGHQLACGNSCSGGQTCGGSTPEVCGCATDRIAGPSLASVGASITTPQMAGGLAAWDGFDKLGAEDDAGAQLYVPSPLGMRMQSQYLLASGFGFNLPPTASVNGVEVSIRRYASGLVEDNDIALFSGGKRLGGKSGAYPWDTNWSTFSLGYSTDLWGSALTVAQVNSPDFGVGISVTSLGTSNSFVDDVKVTVSYAYRCDCHYLCKTDSQCGSDGCGGTCGSMGGGCGGPVDGGPACEDTLCKPIIYTDSATGLSWHNSGYDYGDCSTLRLGGFADWRVPTLDELRTLVRGCPNSVTGGSCRVTNACTSAAGCRDTACDGCAYQQGSGPYNNYLPALMESAWGVGVAYFSSTKDGTSTWTINYATGAIATMPQGSQLRYRCVRP